MKQELEEMFSLLCGLLVAQNFRRASTLVEDKDYKDNAGLFQKVETAIHSLLVPRSLLGTGFIILDF